MMIKDCELLLANKAAEGAKKKRIAVTGSTGLDRTSSNTFFVDAKV